MAALITFCFAVDARLPAHPRILAARQTIRYLQGLLSLVKHVVRNHLLA